MADRENARYCANCRAALPPDAESCPQCGTYAGDVFDGRMPKRRRRSRFAPLYMLLVIAGMVFVWQFVEAKKPANYDATTRVVHDRPGETRRAAGAKLTEAEAMRELRRAITTSRAMRSECLAAIGHGYRDGAWRFTVVDSCKNERLGDWKVVGSTGAVSR